MKSIIIAALLGTLSMSEVKCIVDAAQNATVTLP
jgi:hypothetical protein